MRIISYIKINSNKIKVRWNMKELSYEEKLEIISKKLKEVLERTRERISRGLLG